jgi:hypothetical protein
MPSPQGLALALLSSGCVLGCVTPVAFDPAGDEVSLHGSWLLRLGTDGEPMDPTTENCQQLGVAQVQLVLYGEFNQRYAGEEFRYPCSAGRFDTGQVLRHGVYWTQYVGLDAEGEEVGRSVRALMDVLFQEEATVATEGDADVISVRQGD